MTKPRLVVVAGPNGSGKSTLIDRLSRQGVVFGRYINADDLARDHHLVGDDGARAAQAMADRFREEYLCGMQDSSFETVMSHPSKVEFMLRAKERGYRVTLYFVAVANPLINIMRVRNRVDKGGHDVPVDRIVERYARVLELLPSAVAAADEAIIFDNSGAGIGGEGGLHVVARSRTSNQSIVIDLSERHPSWVADHLIAEPILFAFRQKGFEVTVNQGAFRL